MQGLWSLIGKVGTSTTVNFPYEIGEIIAGLEGKSIWELHSGKSKATGEAVSIFVFNVKDAKEDEIKVAKAAFRRLKTLRHPNFLRFIDGVESDTVVYIATEPVVTLQYHLENDESAKNDLAISWGIHQIVAGLSFLINDCKLIHSNVTIASIFVDPAGEWKLGGVDYIFAVDPPAGADNTLLPRLPTLQKYDPPEGRTYNKSNRKVEKWSMDMWGLGCLIWEVFNGCLPRTSALKAVGKIPKNLLADYCQLVGANPKARPNPSKFIDECCSSGHYLNNSFVDANLFLAELQIKDQKEQKEFFASLTSQLDSFPQQFCKFKILPQLLNAFDYGAAGSSVLAPLFKVGKLLDDDDYQKKIVPCVVKLFSSTDRATRIQLLQQLDNFIQHLQTSTVNDQIFPHVALGFGDTVPAMREHTVKAMLLLASKLSEKTINNQLLKYFAKLQMDEQPGIRTNTTVCLGKIAKHISEATRQKVLVSAFLRSLRDPFPPARNAGIMAFCATHEYYSVKDCATRILPPLCTMTVDPERSVRDQAFKAIKAFLGKVEKASEDPQSQLDVAGQDEQGSDSTAAAGTTSWAGWAVSSLTSKLYRGSADTTGNIDSTQTKPSTETAAPDTTKNDDPPSEEKKSEPKEKSKEEEDNYDDGDDNDEKWEDDWEDNQEDDIMSGLKNELLGVKQECRAVLSKDSRQSADTGNDSGSDYGDWQSDDWGTDSFPNSPVSKTSSKNQERGRSTGKGKQGKTEDDLVAELLGGGNVPNKQHDTGWEEDNWASEQLSNMETPVASSDWVDKKSHKTPPLSRKVTTETEDWGDEWEDNKESQPQTKSTAKSNARSTRGAKTSRTKTQPGGIDWGNEWTDFDSIASTTVKPAGDWGETDDWGELGSSSNAPSKTDVAKQKKLEERKLRQQALRDKRAAAASKGPLKLGGVKKAS